MSSISQSDTDILDHVQKRLMNTGYSHHRRLKVTTENGVVVITGRMPSFYVRQVAIECVRRVPGVMRVVDRISVGDCADQFDIQDGVAGS